MKARKFDWHSFMTDDDDPYLNELVDKLEEELAMTEIVQPLFQTLYKKDSKGVIREWHMEVDGDKYRTVAGIAGGNKVTSAWKTAKPKNVGRSNATTAEEQAILEVEAKYVKKLDGEYHESVDTTDTKKFFKPMLADKWENRKDKIEYPVYVQPKLDGIRCIATRDGLFSRQGKPIVACPHIEEALKPWFDRFPDDVFDGELYNHEYHDDFNKIVSMVKKTKPKDEDLVESAAKVQYHIYDIPSIDDVFQPRYKLYKDAVKSMKEDCIVAVPTASASSEEEVDMAYAGFLEDMYEGGIVRANTLYEQKRSKNLLKRKDFQDEEFEIIRIEQGTGNWEGYAKRVFFRLEDGRECVASLKGTQEYCKQVLAEADEYVGKQVTVTYFALTPDGIPRFPVAKTIYKTQRDL